MGMCSGGARNPRCVWGNPGCYSQTSTGRQSKSAVGPVSKRTTALHIFGNAKSRPSSSAPNKSFKRDWRTMQLVRSNPWCASRLTQPLDAMITVIGKLADIDQYVGREGFNVLARREDWSPEVNQRFIDEAIQRGDHLLFTSWSASGQYREELLQIVRRLTPVVADVLCPHCMGSNGKHTSRCPVWRG